MENKRWYPLSQVRWLGNLNLICHSHGFFQPAYKFKNVYRFRNIGDGERGRVFR